VTVRTHTHPPDYVVDLAPTDVTDAQFLAVRERYGILPGDDLETMKAKILALTTDRTWDDDPQHWAGEVHV